MAHSHPNNNEGIRNIQVAFFLNLGFTVVEIFGGFFTNSMAILSDALHDLGDSLSLGMAWYFEKLSTKSRDKFFSFGYKRFSLLGAVINSMVLFTGSVIILVEAVPRLFNPQHSDFKGMFLLAIFGIIVNGAAMFRLRKGKSLNEKTVALHFLEDILGWVAILFGSITMMFVDFPQIDTIISILIAGFILSNVYKNIKSSFMILLQGVPENVDIAKIKSLAMQVERVKDVHDIHAWSMDGRYNIVTLHIVVDNNLDMEEIRKIKDGVKNEMQKMDFNHVTIEFEIEDEFCGLEDC